MPLRAAVFVFPGTGLSSRVTAFFFFFFFLTWAIVQRRFKEKDVLYLKHQASESVKKTIYICSSLSLHILLPWLSRLCAPENFPGKWCPPLGMVPSGISQLTVPLLLGLFSKEAGRILHGTEVICIHICHCLEGSQFVRDCYQDYFKKKQILFLLPSLFFTEKRTLNQIELETRRTEKQSFPTSNSIQ